MYIMLFSIVLIVGLLFLFLPSNNYHKWFKGNAFSVVVRITGIILCIISIISIYAVLSGRIVLPLIK